MRRREKVSSASAAEAALPRIVWATRLSLRGLVRRPRIDAAASLSASRRSAAGLPMSAPSRLLVAGVAVEGPGRCEFAELVPDHVFGDQHRDEFVPVIDAEGEPDKLRKDRRPTGPGADHLVAPRPTCRLRLFEEIAVDKRPLPYRACQAFPPRRLALVAAAHDQPVRRLVVPSLSALCRLAPRRDRMPATRGATLAPAMRMIDRVHRDAAHRRPAAEPAAAAGLAY